MTTCESQASWIASHHAWTNDELGQIALMKMNPSSLRSSRSLLTARCSLQRVAPPLLAERDVMHRDKDGKVVIKNLSEQEVVLLLSEHFAADSTKPERRAHQLSSWVYRKRVRSLDEADGHDSSFSSSFKTNFNRFASLSGETCPAPCPARPFLRH